jgi:hypothetical protein
VHERDVALFDAIAGALTATDVEVALEAALREIVHALDLAWRRSPTATSTRRTSTSLPVRGCAAARKKVARR